MRFNCDKYNPMYHLRERSKAKTKWHKHFCLLPKRINNKININNPSEKNCIWLETIWRKRTLHDTPYGSYYIYEYKDQEDKPND